MSEQTLRVVPKNGHVYDPVRKTNLKQVEQDLPRTPHWLSALRVGDLIEVSAPEAPKPKSAPKADAVADKKAPSDTSKKPASKASS